MASQLVLMAFMQRIVTPEAGAGGALAPRSDASPKGAALDGPRNGGGWIDREYGVGRGRIDLLVRWPWRDAEGRRQVQREAVELRAWREGRPDPLARGLGQLDGYLESLGLPTGLLVVFDRRASADPIEVRTRLETARTPSGREVMVLRA